MVLIVKILYTFCLREEEQSTAVQHRVEGAESIGGIRGGGG